LAVARIFCLGGIPSVGNTTAGICIHDVNHRVLERGA